MKYTTVLFDLDGTLTDPAEGITNSIVYALHKWNIEVEDKKSLYKFIGPPLVDSFTRDYGFSREDALLTVDFYREYFSVKGLFENSVYEGIPALLAELKKEGLTVALGRTFSVPGEGCEARMQGWAQAGQMRRKGLEISSHNGW